MSESQEGGTTPRNDEELLRDLAMQLKQHVEYKEWDALERLLALPSVWVFDRNVSVAAAIAEARAVLGTAADVQLTLDRITRMSFAESEVAASMITRVLWSEGETWAEHETAVEMHVTFTRADGEWRYASLGFTHAPAAAPEPAAADAPELQFSSQPFGFDAGYFASLDQSYFTAGYFGLTDSPYFGAGSFVGAAPAPPAATSGGPSHHVLYMPVFVPAELLEGHLPRK